MKKIQFSNTCMLIEYTEYDETSATAAADTKKKVKLKPGGETPPSYIHNNHLNKSNATTIFISDLDWEEFISEFVVDNLDLFNHKLSRIRYEQEPNSGIWWDEEQDNTPDWLGHKIGALRHNTEIADYFDNLRREYHAFSLLHGRQLKNSFPLLNIKHPHDINLDLCTAKEYYYMKLNMFMK